MSATIKSCVLLLFLAAAAQSRYSHRADIHRGVAEVKLVATWEEARERCQRDGAILASPLNGDLLEYLQSHISVNKHTTAYFIGMKAKLDPELQYVSIEGTDLDDLPEAVINMIDHIDPNDGDCLCMDQHNIRAVSCWERLPYMCYTSESSQPSPSSELVEPVHAYGIEEVVSTRDCGPGYERYSTGSCYKPHEETATWDVANQVCIEEGGHLVVINDEAEAELIMDIRPSTSVWTFVGLRKSKSDGQWYSVQGDRFENVYHVWAPDRFNNFDCGFLRPGAKLDDLYCDSHKEPFICEKSG